MRALGRTATLINALALIALSVNCLLIRPGTPQSHTAPQSAAVLGSSQIAATHPTTIVSLTFDDAYSTQWVARDILRTHRIVGTFYIPSGFIGLDGRMTVQQLMQLQADGNEIGGHSVNHFNLPTVDDAEQRRQICDDRVALTQYGFRVTSFAYPFGAMDARSEAAARGCGYNSARDDGGLDNATAAPCDGCLFAETVPPQDPYSVRTANPVVETVPPRDPYSVRTASPIITSTTLELVENNITQAEQHGGGWVPLVFHDICDHCSEQATSPETLSALVSWLQSRASQGTVIKTVDQVIGGTNKRAVKGPQDTRTSGELVNASLETPGPAGGASSYCWTQTGYGANTGSWSRIAAAHTGPSAAQVTVSNYQSGDQKMIIQEDSGSCSPKAEPGQAFNLSAWYTSSAPTRFVVFYRTPKGNWRFLAESPSQPAAATWTHASWTTPAMPPDATRLSYGLQLAANGMLTIDDYGLTEEQPPVPYLTILIISITGLALLPTACFLIWRFRRRAPGVRPVTQEKEIVEV